MAEDKEIAGIAITDNYDINAWYESYLSMRENIESGFKLIYGITVLVDDIHLESDQPDSCYLTILVQNEEGQKNLFKLLSLGATKYKEQALSEGAVHFSDLLEYKKGLLIGLSCDNSFLSSDYDSKEEAWHRSRIERLMDELDYIEVAPATYNPHYPFDKIGSADITEWLIQYADTYNKPVVAVSAAKYIDGFEAKPWKILQYNTHSDGKVYMEEYVKAHLRSAEELLESFAYLGMEKANEIVIENPLKIAESINLTKPFSMEGQIPYKDVSKKEIADICFDRAHKLYGTKLPKEVKERIDTELSALTESKHETIIMKMRELVYNTKVISEPHNVRGTLDNSFVAFLCGISIVNPLKPHYLCDKCHYSDFDTDDLRIKIGFGLPDEVCPCCGEKLGRDGFNLPFEGAFGIDGDKIPNLELNVRPSIQKDVQAAISSLEGIKTSFKGMTCRAIYDKKAETMIDRYQAHTNTNIDGTARKICIQMLSGCIEGYDLHPARVFLFPEGVGDVTDYFPLYKNVSGDVVSGVDFHRIDNVLYSMSILAFDPHELLYKLETDTKHPLTDISFTEGSVFEEIPKGKDGELLLEGIFDLESERADDIIRTVMGTKGGIDFLDLVQINGMIHGTGAWYGNGQELMEKGYDFCDLIATREDCYDYFIQHGLDHRTAFTLMEDIRKGKAAREAWIDKWKDVIEECDIPEWYIDSCKKIKFLFPRAYCASHAMIQWQLMYYKIHYPEIFDRTYKDV